VLPATRHKRTRSALISLTRFTYAGGMEGWVDLVDLGVELATLQHESDAEPLHHQGKEMRGGG